MTTATDHLKPPKPGPGGGYNLLDKPKLRKLKKGEKRNIRKMMRHRIWTGQAHSSPIDGDFEYKIQPEDRDQFQINEDLIDKTVRVKVKKVTIKKEIQVY